MIIYPNMGTESDSEIKTTSPLVAGLNTARKEILLTNRGGSEVLIKRGAGASAINFDFPLAAGEKCVIDNWQMVITCFPDSGVSINVAILK